MINLNKVTLLGFVYTLGSLGFAKGEYCGYYNGYRWYCDDSDTYCCGYRDGSALCCQYDPFYTWWYFWLGIAGFVFFVSLIAALCRRRRYQNAQIARSRAQLQTAVVTQSVATGYANPNFPIDASAAAAPPPYPVVTNEQKDISAPPPYNPQDYIPDYPQYPPVGEAAAAPPSTQNTDGNP